MWLAVLCCRSNKCVLMRKNLYLLFAGVLLSSAVNGQYNLGVSTGNWSGLNALYMNPAAIADSRERFAIDIVGLTAGVDNNLGTIGSVNSLFKAINNGNTNNLINYNGNSKFSLMGPYAQVHLPGIMVSINSKNSIALTTSIRGMNQFNNFDQSLYRTISDSTYLPNGNIDLTSNKFNYTAHLWSEAGLSYAGVVWQTDEHEIKVGATLRYLGGIGYLGLKGNNLDAHYKSGSDSLYVSNTDVEYASNVVSTKSAVLNGVSGNNILSQFFGAKDGSGVGGDIGVIYDYSPACCSECAKANRKDHSKNNYLLRFSASVMDIGHITYKSSTNSNAEVTGNGNISGQDFSNNVKTFDDFRHYAVAHGFTADTNHVDTKLYMPTTLRIGADYHAYKWIYVNAMFIGSLANRQNFGNSYYNQVSVTPRFDTRLFSIGVPVTYDVLTSTVKTGLGLRFSGFYIGSDDMLAFFASHQSGLNVYAGGFVAINKKRPKNVDSTDLAPEPDMEHGGSVDTLGGSASILMMNYHLPTPTQPAGKNADVITLQGLSAEQQMYIKKEEMN